MEVRRLLEEFKASEQCTAQASAAQLAAAAGADRAQIRNGPSTSPAI